MTSTCSQCLQEFELSARTEATLPHFCGKDCELAAIGHSDSAMRWLAQLDAEMEEMLTLAKRG